MCPDQRHGGPRGFAAKQFALGVVSRVVAFPDGDFVTAIDEIKQSGVELIVGSEAKELLCKMEQVKEVARSS